MRVVIIVRCATFPPSPKSCTNTDRASQPDHNTEQNYAIAPDLQVTTTYRRPHPESTLGKHLGEVGEAGLNWQEPPSHIYSRYTSDTRSRSEKVLSGLLDANAITYASGLAASYSAVLHYAPSVIAIRKGYFGVHAGIEIYQRAHQVRIIDLDDEYPTLPKETRGNGDQTPKGGLLVWVESPLNPTGEARDLRHYAARTHAAGGVMAVDSTFAPLQDVFACGADMVMHSATKYFGGHSDLLAGIIAVKSKAEWDQLFLDRSHIGNMPGNMEAWLLLRSLRSLQVRWRQQSSTALLLANWLQTLVPSADAPAASDVVDNALTNAGLVQRVWHASFQPRQDADPSPNPRFAEGKDFDPRNQFTAGFPATFAFRVRTITLVSARLQ